MPQKGLEWQEGKLEPNFNFWVNYHFKCVFKHFAISFLILYVVSKKKEKLMSQSVIDLLLLYDINVEIIETLTKVCIEI